MTKLLYKQSPLENTVIRSIDNSIGYLNQAVREIYSMDIPGDFSQSGNLRNCLNGIKNVKSSLTDLKSWGNNSVKKIDNSLENMTNVAALLPKSQVEVRNEVVR